MPTTTDLIGLALDKNPVDFADMFNQLAMQKAAAALENKKIELAQAIYAAEDEEDTEVVDDDLDLDLDDLDIDLEDLDLDSEDISYDEDA
jgi:hypothetical protein